ncbi:cytochrome P450 [Cubamyces lactineus]|nr:cytochrome P450 [Cubamyces lactineus]
MSINLASIHTTSMSVTIVLFLLAQSPEYIEPLRKEMQSVIEDEGWTKASFGRMWKLDSFLKEILRHSNIDTVIMVCRALKDIRLSDGTVIARGGLVAAASDAMHHDSALYDNAGRFYLFRFAHMCEAKAGATKHQLMHASHNYLSFGYGRDVVMHSSPGRFFVANELKSLLSYFLLNFDLKLSDDGLRTPSCHGMNIILLSGSLLFKKRKNSVHYEAA